MKVSNLLGVKLDCWAAKADGWTVEPKGRGFLIRRKDEDGMELVCYIGEFQSGFLCEYAPSTNHHQGGPIIEREHIKLKAGLFEKWHADLKAPYYKYSMEGPTALIAAMRAFVSSRFGPEVDDC